MNKNIKLEIEYQKVEHRRKLTGMHAHEYHELYFLIGGETAYFVGDEIYRLVPNDFILVKKGLIHATDSQSCLHNERLLIKFRSETVTEQTEKYFRLLADARQVRPKEGSLQIFTQLLQKLRQEDQNSDLATVYLQELLILLERHGERGVLSSDGYISKISQYIRENYQRELSLCELSKRFGISESSLSRKFKNEVGMGLWEFITQVRIYNAERILMLPDMTVTRAAELCGFSDSNYFGTVFKKVKGITPLQYKKQNGL